MACRMTGARSVKRWRSNASPYRCIERFRYVDARGMNMKAALRSLPVVARVLLGLVFFVFGLNGFLHFLPAPPMAGPAGAFAGALAATGYMFPLIKGTEVIAGALLLTNRFVPLALALLAPVVVNIFLFHTVLTPPNPVACVVLVLEVFLAWSYRAAYRTMLAAKVVADVHGSSVEDASPSPIATAAGGTR